MNKMNFRIWFENKELVTLNEDYKTALEKFVKANPHANREAVRKYIDEFKTIVTKKYKQIYDPLPSVSVPTNKRNNIDAYPTFEELEAVVDHVKGQVDFSGKVNFKDVEVDAKPVFEKHGVIHYCVPNIASRVAETASTALSNLFAPILLRMGENGGFDGFIRNDRGLRNGVYLFNGILTNKYLGDKYKLPYKDINLLMSAF
jgi:hypothetical protein